MDSGRWWHLGRVLRRVEDPGWDEVLPGQSARRIPVVVLANARGALPSSIVALVGTGRAGIVIEGGTPPSMNGGTVRIALPDSLSAEIRLSEPVDRLGNGGGAPDTIVEESTLRGDDNAALQVALRMVRAGRPPATSLGTAAGSGHCPRPPPLQGNDVPVTRVSPARGLPHLYDHGVLPRLSRALWRRLGPGPQDLHSPFRGGA